MSKGIQHPTDLAGLKTGYLTVVEFVKRDKNSKQLWLCHCDACGNDKIMSRSYLLSGQAKSCGCKMGYHLAKRCDLSAYNTYKLEGEYGIGYTSKGEEFYFDKEDYKKIKDYAWSINDNGYVVSGGRNKVAMHRLIMDIQDSSAYVDHIHHRKNDNRKAELRVVTPSQNQMNSVGRHNSSGFKGVSWHKNRKAWIAQIQINDKLKYLGIYKDLEDAKRARIAAEKELFGEYAYNAI